MFKRRTTPSVCLLSETHTHTHAHTRHRVFAPVDIWFPRFPLSLQVEALLTHDALSRPGAVLNVHLAGVPSSALLAGAAAVAGDLPHAVRHMEDCHAAHAAVAALGCGEATTAAELTADCASGDASPHQLDNAVLAELAAAAGAELTTEGFTFAGDEGAAAFTLPRAGGGAEVDALLRELACFLGNAKAALGAAPQEGAATQATQRLLNARLERAAGVRGVFGAGSREAAAAARLTAGAAKAAVARAHHARGGQVVSLVTVPDAQQLDEATAAAAAAVTSRRALLAEGGDGVGAAAGGFPPLTPSQKFRNMSVATVVAVIIFVVAACGVLAMVTMSFPSDSLLYPRDKND
jgi:hypothetical protein